MNKEMEEFLRKLAALCNEYRAGLGYSADDDGVLVTIGREATSIGWPSGRKPGDEILDKVFSR